jgi:hypothetical protein
MGGGTAGVVGGVAGSVDAGCGMAEGLVCGDCADSDAENARLATAANRIGAKLGMVACRTRHDSGGNPSQ